MLNKIEETLNESSSDDEENNLKIVDEDDMNMGDTKLTHKSKVNDLGDLMIGLPPP